MARRRVWTTQPPAGTPIDWDSPLSQALKVLFCGWGRPYDPASGQLPTASGAPSSQGIKGWSFPAATDGFELATVSSVEFSAFGLAYAYQASADQALVSTSTSSPNYYQNFVLSISGNSTLPRMGFSTGGGAQYPYFTGSGASPASGTLHLYGGCFDGTTQRLYLDGVPYGSNLVGGAPDTLASYPTEITAVGNADLPAGGAQYQGAGLLLAGAYTRNLSADEWALLGRNPWQIFHRRQRFYSIAASTGAVFTASPTMPDAIVAGQAALSIAASAAPTVPAGIAQASAALAITGSVAIAVPDGIVTAALSSGAVLTAALTAQRGIPQSSASLSIATTASPTVPSALPAASAALSIALTGSATVPAGMARANAGAGSVFSVAIVAQTGAISATGALSIAATGTITAAAPPVSARSALSIAGAVETAIPDAEARAAASTASGSVLSAALRMPTASPAIQAQLVVSANIAIAVPDALVTAAGIIGSTPNPCMMVYLPARKFTVTLPARKFTVTLKC